MIRSRTLGAVSGLLGRAERPERTRPASTGVSAKRDQQAAWLFLSPVLVLGVVFFLIPLGLSFYLSFTRWDVLTAPRPVGLANYVYLITIDPNFWRTLANTLLFALGTVVIGLPLALLLAFTFTRARGQVAWRSIYWLPMITNVVAIGYIWQFIFNGRIGLIDQALGLIGLDGPDWLQEPALAMIAVIGVNVWWTLGQNMLLFAAGLAAIDPTLYEAARIDGAKTRHLFWRITLPLLRPTIVFVAITNFITGMASFALILVLTDGGPLGATNVTALYMYQTAFRDLRMGRASAAAFILFAIVLALTLAQLWYINRKDDTA